MKLFVISVIYGMLGFTLEINGIIKAPAFWALYGFAFGVIAMTIGGIK